MLADCRLYGGSNGERKSKINARARRSIDSDGRFRRSVSLELFPALVSRFIFATFNSGDYFGWKIEETLNTLSLCDLRRFSYLINFAISRLLT